MIVIQMLLPRFLVLEVSELMFLVKCSLMQVRAWGGVGSVLSLGSYQYNTNYSFIGRLIFPFLTIGTVL